MEELPLYFNRALEPRNQSEKPQGSSRETPKHESLEKRATNWKEQVYADEALIIDSQYK
jgi:hypothetical protein